MCALKAGKGTPCTACLPVSSSNKKGSNKLAKASSTLSPEKKESQPAIPAVSSENKNTRRTEKNPVKVSSAVSSDKKKLQPATPVVSPKRKLYARRRQKKAAKKSRAGTPKIDNTPITVATTPPTTAIPESFAIVHVAGHQYKVTKGDTVMVDKLPVDIGEDIILSKVLMVGTKDFTAIGTPLLKQAAVSATVQEQTKTSKVIIFKKKRRKNSEKTQGHRQEVTVMQINEIFMDHAEMQSQK